MRNPSSNTLTRRSRGSSVFEFVLVLPAAAVVIVAMVGSAQTVLLRQQALIAARQAAFYQRVTGCVASPQLIGQSIPTGNGVWQVGASGQGGSGNSLQIPGGSSIFSALTGFIAGADGAIAVKTRITPRRGYIAQRFQISDAAADYSLIGGYWTSTNCSVIVGALTSLLGSVGDLLGNALGFSSPTPGGGC